MAGSGSRGPATDQGNHFLTYPRPSHRPGVGPGSTVLKRTRILHDSLMDPVAFTFLLRLVQGDSAVCGQGL